MPPAQEGVHREAIERHLEKHIGPVATVFHELVSDLVHLDVLYIAPSEKRPFQTLVTSGSSDLPMEVPSGMEAFRRAEYLVNLPADWSLDRDNLEDETHYWPIRWLKLVGRLAHEYQTWLGWGHTVPNGDPATPIADTGFIGVTVLPPYWLGSDFFQLPTVTGDVITFYNLVPLYPEEMDLKLRKGIEAIEKKDRDGTLFQVLDVNRPNLGKRRFLPW